MLMLPLTPAGGDCTSPGAKCATSPKNSFQRAVSFRLVPGGAVSTNSRTCSLGCPGCEPHTPPPSYSQDLAHWAHRSRFCFLLAKSLAPEEITGL